MVDARHTPRNLEPKGRSTTNPSITIPTACLDAEDRLHTQLPLFPLFATHLSPFPPIPPIFPFSPFFLRYILGTS